MNNKTPMLDALCEYFENTPEEEIEAAWKKTEIYSNVGPTVDEYFERLNNYNEQLNKKIK